MLSIDDINKLQQENARLQSECNIYRQILVYIQEVCRNILNKYADHSLGTVNYANLFLSKINEVIK
jgi:hemerythrin-like domain-containing protein